MKRRGLVFKAVSIAVLLSFAASESSLVPFASAVLPAAPAAPDPQGLDVPFQHVILKEVHVVPGQPFIFHIQDAHANLSGQENLASALDYWMGRYDIPLVFVEGASRDVTLDALKRIAPPETWRQAAKRLLYDGVISGEEYLNLSSDRPMQIIGVEERGLYDRDLAAYAALTAGREEAIDYLRLIRAAVDRLKNRLYPPELASYEALRGPGEFGGKAHVDALVKISAAAAIDPAAGRPETARFLDLRRREDAIDFRKATEEEESLVRAILKAGGSESLRDAAAAFGKNANGQVAQHALMQGLFGAARGRGVDIAQYPELGRYSEYLEAFAALRMDALFAELRSWEDAVYAALVKDEDARKLRAVDLYVGLLEKAYRIRMGSEEFARLEANEADFAVPAWQGFLNLKLAEAGFADSIIPYKPVLEEGKPRVKAFYALVEERDFAFIRNLKRALDEKKSQSAFLITGGYHTEHLTELMRAAGISYAVFTPIVSFETDQAKYEKLLLAPLAKTPAAPEEAEAGAEAPAALQIGKLGERGLAVARAVYPDGDVPILDGAAQKQFWDYLAAADSQIAAAQVLGSRSSGFIGSKKQMPPAAELYTSPGDPLLLSTGSELVLNPETPIQKTPIRYEVRLHDDGSPFIRVIYENLMAPGHPEIVAEGNFDRQEAGLAVAQIGVAWTDAEGRPVERRSATGKKILRHQINGQTFSATEEEQRYMSNISRAQVKVTHLGGSKFRIEDGDGTKSSTNGTAYLGLTENVDADSMSVASGAEIRPAVASFRLSPLFPESEVTVRRSRHGNFELVLPPGAALSPKFAEAVPAYTAEGRVVVPISVQDVATQKVAGISFANQYVAMVDLGSASMTSGVLGDLELSADGAVTYRAGGAAVHESSVILEPMNLQEAYTTRAAGYDYSVIPLLNGDTLVQAHQRGNPAAKAHFNYIAPDGREVSGAESFLLAKEKQIDGAIFGRHSPKAERPRNVEVIMPVGETDALSRDHFRLFLPPGSEGVPMTTDLKSRNGTQIFLPSGKRYKLAKDKITLTRTAGGEEVDEDVSYVDYVREIAALRPAAGSRTEGVLAFDKGATREVYAAPGEPIRVTSGNFADPKVEDAPAYFEIHVGDDGRPYVQCIFNEDGNRVVRGRAPFDATTEDGRAYVQLGVNRFKENEGTPQETAVQQYRINDHTYPAWVGIEQDILRRISRDQVRVIHAGGSVFILEDGSSGRVGELSRYGTRYSALDEEPFPAAVTLSAGETEEGRFTLNAADPATEVVVRRTNELNYEIVMPEGAERNPQSPITYYNEQGRLVLWLSVQDIARGIAREITIGTDSDNTVILNRPGIEPRHGAIHFETLGLTRYTHSAAAAEAGVNGEVLSQGSGRTAWPIFEQRPPPMAYRIQIMDIRLNAYRLSNGDMLIQARTPASARFNFYGADGELRNDYCYLLPLEQQTDGAMFGRAPPVQGQPIVQIQRGVPDENGAVDFQEAGGMSRSHFQVKTWTGSAGVPPVYDLNSMNGTGITTPARAYYLKGGEVTVTRKDGLKADEKIPLSEYEGAVALLLPAGSRFNEADAQKRLDAINKRRVAEGKPAARFVRLLGDGQSTFTDNYEIQIAGVAGRYVMRVPGGIMDDADPIISRSGFVKSEIMSARRLSKVQDKTGEFHPQVMDWNAPQDKSQDPYVVIRYVNWQPIADYVRPNGIYDPARGAEAVDGARRLYTTLRTKARLTFYDVKPDAPIIDLDAPVGHRVKTLDIGAMPTRKPKAPSVVDEVESQARAAFHIPLPPSQVSEFFVSVEAGNDVRVDYAYDVGDGRHEEQLAGQWVAGTPTYSDSGELIAISFLLKINNENKPFTAVAQDLWRLQNISLGARAPAAPLQDRRAFLRTAGRTALAAGLGYSLGGGTVFAAPPKRRGAAAAAAIEVPKTEMEFIGAAKELLNVSVRDYTAVTTRLHKRPDFRSAVFPLYKNYIAGAPKDAELWKLVADALRYLAENYPPRIYSDTMTGARQLLVLEGKMPAQAAGSGAVVIGAGRLDAMKADKEAGAAKLALELLHEGGSHNLNEEAKRFRGPSAAHPEVRAREEFAANLVGAYVMAGDRPKETRLFEDSVIDNLFFVLEHAADDGFGGLAARTLTQSPGGLFFADEARVIAAADPAKFRSSGMERILQIRMDHRVEALRKIKEDAKYRTSKVAEFLGAFADRPDSFVIEFRAGDEVFRRRITESFKRNDFTRVDDADYHYVLEEPEDVKKPELNSFFARKRPELHASDRKEADAQLKQLLETFRDDLLAHPSSPLNDKDRKTLEDIVAAALKRIGGSRQAEAAVPAPNSPANLLPGGFGLDVSPSEPGALAQSPVFLKLAAQPGRFAKAYFAVPGSRSVVLAQKSGANLEVLNSASGVFVPLFDAAAVAQRAETVETAPDTTDFLADSEIRNLGREARGFIRTLRARVADGRKPGGIVIHLDDFVERAADGAKDASFRASVAQIAEFGKVLARPEIGVQLQIAGSPALVDYAVSAEGGLAAFSEPLVPGLRPVHIGAKSTLRALDIAENEAGVLLIEDFAAPVEGIVTVRNVPGNLYVAAELGMMDPSAAAPENLVGFIARTKRIHPSAQIGSVLGELSRGRKTDDTLERARTYVALPRLLGARIADILSLMQKLVRAISTAA